MSKHLDILMFNFILYYINKSILNYVNNSENILIIALMRNACIVLLLGKGEFDVWLAIIYKVVKSWT